MSRRASALGGQAMRRQIAGHRRFRHAVEHADPRPEQRQAPVRTPAAECASRRHGSPAGVAAARSSPSQMIEPAHELRRHQRRPRGAGLRDARGQRFGIGAAAQHHGGAGEQMRHHDDLRDRPERTHVQEDGVARRSRSRAIVFCATVMRLRWRSMTAFGAPVVPPLKLSVASRRRRLPAAAARTPSPAASS